MTLFLSASLVILLPNNYLLANGTFKVGKFYSYSRVLFLTQNFIRSFVIHSNFFPTHSYMFFQWKTFQMRIQDFRFFIPPLFSSSLMAMFVLDKFSQPGLTFVRATSQGHIVAFAKSIRVCWKRLARCKQYNLLTGSISYVVKSFLTSIRGHYYKTFMSVIYEFL